MASSSKKSVVKVNLFGKRNPEDDLETKPILKKHKETSYQTEEKEETTRGFADSLQHKSHDQVQEAAVLKNTLLIANLAPQTIISDIIDFFKDAVQVVHVQLAVHRRGIHRSYGFVEFASATETNKALEKKNGEYLHDRKIFLKVTTRAPQPKYCIDHKVCCRDYLRRETLPIEENETPPDFVEEVLFVANLSPQTIFSDIMYFFKDVGEVVSVWLIVNHEGKHVGYAFVDFASAYQAKKALEKKNGEYLHGHQIFLEVAKTAPDPPRPNYEDYLRRQNIVIEEDETVEGLDETPDFVEANAVRKKTLFVSGLSREADIFDIINFFKDVGEVVHVRLIVDYMGKHDGDGFVEFASANEAEEALEKKDGEYMHDHKIFLHVAEKAPYPLRPE
ncbi:unnamed protein product [Arabidopsis lyrata]|nr:unnamed protein product [Arabidopsis lyrata]